MLVRSLAALASWCASVTPCRRRYIHNLLKYEFDLQFEVPVTYPATAPELELPELDGETERHALAFPCPEPALPLQARRPRCTAAARFA